MKRNQFIKLSSGALIGSVLLPKFSRAASNPDKKVKLAFIGLGERGSNHLENALYRTDIEVVAICDTDAKALANANKMLKDKGQKVAANYTGSDTAFEKMVLRDDIEGVIISTPWEWHVPMAVATMKAGKYAGVEVSATVTLQESWDLVDTYEKTGSHCMILENVCYRRDVLAVLNMVRQNMFGELLHLQCGYQHDLREVKFNNGKQVYGGGVEFGANAISEAKWRTQHSVDRNGDVYPTHGLGPVAQMVDINRGNNFVSLTATASKPRGLHKYIVDKGGENHPNAKVNFKLGDIVTTVIKCANGETILISHDTNNPRPYSLNFRVQGTNGLWMDDFDSIYLENISPKAHRYEPFEKYQTQFDHPLWKAHEKRAELAGHGGIDYFVLNGFVEAIKNKTAPTIDVYDAAAWSAISPLSEQSIANGSSSVQIPDFTRGKWKTNKPIFGLNNLY